MGIGFCVGLLFCIFMSIWWNNLPLQFCLIHVETTKNATICLLIFFVIITHMHHQLYVDKVEK